MTLYELYTGQAPYVPETWFKLASQIVSQPLPKLNRTGSRAPEWLETFVAKAAAKEPSDRFQSMDEAADFLEKHFRPNAERRGGARIVERLADGLAAVVQQRASAVVFAGFAMLALVASIGFSNGPTTEVHQQVEAGTSAVGKVVDTLQKLNKVVMTTYENSDKIDRFLEEEERKKHAAAPQPSPTPAAIESRVQKTEVEHKAPIPAVEKTPKRGHAHRTR